MSAPGSPPSPHACGAPESEHRPDDIYAQYADLGLPYGPEFRRIQNVTRHADGFAIGELRGIDTPAVEHLPASVLDCAMQTLAAVVNLSDAYLPIGFDNIELVRKPKGELRSLIQLTSPAVSADDAAGDLGADIVVLDGDRTVFIVEGLRLKRVASAAGARRVFHEPRWVKRSLVAPKAAPVRVREVLIVQRSEAGFSSVAGALANAGVRLAFAADAAAAGRLLAERPATSDLCWFWRSAPELQGDARLRAECRQNYTALLELVAELERLGFGRELRVMLVTEGAQWLPGDVTDDRPAELDRRKLAVGLRPRAAERVPGIQGHVDRFAPIPPPRRTTSRCSTNGSPATRPATSSSLPIAAASGT